MIGTSISNITNYEVNQASQTVLNIKNMIANEEASFASSAYEVGDYLRQDSTFYKVTSDISVGDPLVIDGNIKETTVGYELQHRNDTYKIVSWSSGTDEEIVALVEAADNGLVDLYEDAGWRVGDTRTVHLSAMSATGVGESHVAQDVEFVLMHHGDMNLASATASGRIKCSFVVGMKNLLANGTTGEYGYMESTNTNSNGWHGCKRRIWCNNTFRSAIPSTLRSIFKQFTHSVATTYGNTSGVTLSTDYFSLPTEKNVFGIKTRCTQDEFNAADNFQFEWYMTATNRIKKVGSSEYTNHWWECSPYYNYGMFCAVSNSSANYYNASSVYGISPFGVI